MQNNLNNRGDIGSPFAAIFMIGLLLFLIGVLGAEIVLTDHQEKNIKIIQKQIKSISQPALIVATASTYGGEPFSTAFANVYCRFHSGSKERQEITAELQKRIEGVARKSNQKAYLRILDCTNYTCYNVYTYGKMPINPGKMATITIPTAEATMSRSCIEHTEYIKIELLLQE